MNLKQSLKLLLPLVFAVFVAPSGVFALATEPFIQTFGLTATSNSCNEIDIFCFAGDGQRRLIVCSPDNPVSVVPTDGQAYSAGSLFGSGTNLGNNCFVVYNGMGTTLTVTGLAGGTQYYFAAFEFNGLGTNANFLTTNAPTANEIAFGFTMSLSSSSGDMCEGDSVTLEVHGAETYGWSPPNGLSSTVDSLVIAKPTNTQQYTVQGSDNTGCTDSKSVTITVYNVPPVTIGSFNNRCVNANSLNLTSGSPPGGLYTGVGVWNGRFYPDSAGVGDHIIQYLYSDIHGCHDSDTSAITVLSAPTATFSTLNDVCINAAPFALSGGNPGGGTYSGSGVSGGQFNASVAGTGAHTISYTYSDINGCSDTAASSLTVHSLPNVVFTTLSAVCLNTSPFNLTGGSPSGGTYTGTGVSGSQFSPLVAGAGNFILTYSYTDNNNCSASDTSKINVNTLPSVSLSSFPAVCQNSGPVALTGGTPAGGTYSGTAVSGTTFYTAIAGPGTHTITYSYTNGNNCTNTGNSPIVVNAMPHPDLGPDQTICAGSSVHLNPGTFTGYFWTGGASTPTLDLDSTGHGFNPFTIIVSVSNAANCVNRDTIHLIFDPCNGIVDPSSVNSNFIVYPNPSSSSFTFIATPGSDITIYDLKGSIVSEEKNVPAVFSTGENLIAGSYIVCVRKNQDTIYKLILKN